VAINVKETIMRASFLAIGAAALFVLPTSAFSQVDVEVGPEGSMWGPGTTGIMTMATIVVIATEERGVESCG
jgi:hypothetical protein